MDIYSKSKLLILKEKKVRGFWAIKESKKNTNFQKIFKKTEELHKKSYTFEPGAANHTFFYSPCI